MSAAPPRPPFEAGEHPPNKVAWLHPWELLRTAYHAWLSTVAAEYIDRRETLAALDSARVKRTVPADATFQPGRFIDARLHQNRYDRGVSIDFIADIGDSWQATYAMLKLMVTPRLQVHGHQDTSDPADLVVLGGDLVYPTPSRTRYRERTRSALVAARPASSNGNAPCLFAIPGNHDWYDGLTNFVREFCQGQELGGWSMVQRRSYFAVKLMRRWWLWGIDIALDTRIDLPQQSYFLRILNDQRGRPDSFVDGDNIILCTAKPAWLEHVDDSDGYRNLSYFVRDVIEKKGGRVRVILAGDVHHYSRYANAAGDQLITAGGAGSYLSGTHHLPHYVSDLTTPAQESGMAGTTSGIPPKPKNAYHVADFPYPSRTDSRRLALGALFLAMRPANWPFVLLVGFLYWFFVWTLVQADGTVLQPDTLKDLLLLPVELATSPSVSVVFLFVVATLGVSAIVPLASKPTARRWIAIPWGLAHAFLHLTLALVLGWALHHSDTVKAMAGALPSQTGSLAMAAVFSISLILVGGLAGATLVGIYFVLSDFIFGWHTNEVFASQSNVDYRNFLRMQIAPDGTLTIAPIGLRKTPQKWRLALEREPHEPFYESTDYVLAPHLIEAPIVIRPR